MTTPRIEFQHHLQARVMEIHFPDGYSVASQDDIQALKRAWMSALRTWHSPYTCLFDARNFRVDESMREPLARLVTFFKGFFMKKILGFCEEGATPPEGLPFEILSGYEAASKETGLGREGGLKRDLGDLRSRIVVDNDFGAHVMEVSFAAETNLATAADVEVLKSKLTNILMQWHSPYSIVFNCANLKFEAEAKEAFPRLERFLRGFFCKAVIGYAPAGAKDSYPFRVFRARHVAVAELEHEGLVAGDVANCSTKATRGLGKP
jgi:hypothetical protein